MFLSFDHIDNLEALDIRYWGKGIFHPKMKNLQILQINFFTFMSFQTCMTFFLS